MKTQKRYKENCSVFAGLSPPWQARGFTLIELLVVIAIIALLMSIVVPSLRKAHNHANLLICASNQKQLVYGLQTYRIDNNQAYPPSVLGQRSFGDYWRASSWNGTYFINYRSENAIDVDDNRRNGVAGGWIGKFMLPYIPVADVYNCPAANVDLDSLALPGQTYQQLYENGQKAMLECSYMLLWGFGGFNYDDLPGNERRFAGPGYASSSATLLFSDMLAYGRPVISLNQEPNNWYTTHPFRGGNKARHLSYYMLYDRWEENRPMLMLNAGYADGSVRRYSSKDAVRQTTGLTGQYIPRMIR